MTIQTTISQDMLVQSPAFESYALEYSSPQSVSREDVMKSVDNAPKLYQRGFVQVARISETLVVKYGSQVYLSEARAMSYAAKLEHVRVPKVFDAWEVTSVDQHGYSTIMTYILMQFIEGDLISGVWKVLTAEDRLDVYEQIQKMVKQLQETTFERPGPIGGGISHGAYFTAYGAGPFRTCKDVEDWFDERLSVCKDFGHVHPEVPAFAGSLDKLVFCHLDLNAQNIILDNTGKVWLIDWAQAGAYPPYFEHAFLLRAPDPDFTKGILETIDDGLFREEIERLESLNFALTTGVMLQPSDRAVRVELSPLAQMLA